ncbi:MAG: UDP-N-acetylglucosamine 1-carboxyvinyltransferase [Nitrospinales bacterium]
MDKIVIQGGKPLHGQVEISGAKNAALPVLAATILTSGRNHISGLPKVQDVVTMIRLIEELGGNTIQFNDNELVFDTSSINNHVAPYNLVSTMRASCLTLGPLLCRLGKARVSLPGGCAIGARPIDQHIKGLKAMGADIEIENGYIIGKSKGLKGTHFHFDMVTVTGTMNLMMAAVLADGETILENVAREPEVTFLADTLNKSGARIEGAGSDKIIIQGVSEINPIESHIFPDRIEAATYMIACAITKGQIEIKNCVPDHVKSISLKLKEAGVEIEENGTSIKVRGKSPILPVNIETQAYPGFATDVQAQLMALMCLGQGKSVIVENVFENRFMHAPELNRMGANIQIEGHTAIVDGVEHLSGAPVMATDLRASASLVLAGLAAKGETTISRVYHIDRGYQNMEEKLSNLGASIRRIK